MKSLWKNNHGDMNIIISAVIAAIALAIGIIIVFNVMGSLDTTDVDAEFANSTPAANSTTDIQTNVETFYTVMPIVLIVMAAVAILGYVMLLRRT